MSGTRSCKSKCVSGTSSGAVAEEESTLMMYTARGERRVSSRCSEVTAREGERLTVRKGVDLHVLVILLNPLQAGKSVDTCRSAKVSSRAHSLLCQASAPELTINVHSAGSADTLTARATESKGRVQLVLDLEDGVEDHRTALGEVKRVGLKVGLLGRLVGVL